MFERVKQILMKFTEENIEEQSTLAADLGLSSLDVVSVVIEFEDEFNIEVPDREIGKFIYVSDIVKYIEAHT